MKKSEIQVAVEQFQNAFKRLKEASRLKPSELVQDAVIQRFEFTYELSWKTLKRILKAKGDSSKFPRDIFKAAFRQGWIEKDEEFLLMMEDRNLTSHVYDRSEARKIYRRICKSYVAVFESLLASIKKIKL